MFLTPIETILTILAVTLGMMICRFTPFLLFPEHKAQPQIVHYLGKVLPAAMMGLLVVYCLKGISFGVAPYGIPEGIAVGVIVLLHLWKGNVLLSIGGSTVIYMFLVQMVFV